MRRDSFQEEEQAAREDAGFFTSVEEVFSRNKEELKKGYKWQPNLAEARPGANELDKQVIINPIS